jgi:hypothetical protein
MRIITKQQRNALFNIIVSAGLNPADCGLIENDTQTSLTHLPTSSLFKLEMRPYLRGYMVLKAIGDEMPQRKSTIRWSRVESAARKWAGGVKKFAHVPDLWAEFSTGKEFLSDVEFNTLNNAPFSPNEQLRMAEQLQELKSYLVDKYSLSGDQISQIEARLDEIEEATQRIGRKDWLLMFYGVMFTLLVTAVVPPDAVQYIIAMVIHGLGDLFGFGGPPPALPPMT